MRFGLERHLQDVLHDNWDNRPLAGEWALCADDKLRYAVSEIPAVDVQLYEVKFHLRDDDGISAVGV